MADQPPIDEIDQLMARRELRASRRRWRVVAIVALAIVVIAGGWQAGVRLNRPENRPHIARVNITGTIYSDRVRADVLEKLAENDNVSAVLIAIDSPGGATAGGEELYTGIRKLADAKPVVAVISQLGASAAYMTAIAADRVFARRLSVVGSIGVVYTHVNAAALMDTIGVALDRVTTGPLKAQPDFDEPMSPAVRHSLQTLVDDSFDWFVSIVAERRELPRSDVLALADGRIMTGQMGLAAGLIDAIGGEAEAIAWLETERGVATDLPVLTHYPPPPDALTQLRRAIAGGAAEALGIDASAIAPLDGLVSVWHPRL
jgi:protease-4